MDLAYLVFLKVNMKRGDRVDLDHVPVSLDFVSLTHAKEFVQAQPHPEQFTVVEESWTSTYRSSSRQFELRNGTWEEVYYRSTLECTTTRLTS